MKKETRTNTWEGNFRRLVGTWRLNLYSFQIRNQRFPNRADSFFTWLFTLFLFTPFSPFLFCVLLPSSGKIILEYTLSFCRKYVYYSFPISLFRALYLLLYLLLFKNYYCFSSIIYFDVTKHALGLCHDSRYGEQTFSKCLPKYFHCLEMNF